MRYAVGVGVGGGRPSKFMSSVVPPGNRNHDREKERKEQMQS